MRIELRETFLDREQWWAKLKIVRTQNIEEWTLKTSKNAF